MLVATETDIKVSIPMLLTEITQQEYNLEKIKKIEGTPISDTNGKGN